MQQLHDGAIVPAEGGPCLLSMQHALDRMQGRDDGPDAPDHLPRRCPPVDWMLGDCETVGEKEAYLCAGTHVYAKHEGAGMGWATIAKVRGTRREKKPSMVAGTILYDLKFVNGENTTQDATMIHSLSEATALMLRSSYQVDLPPDDWGFCDGEAAPNMELDDAAAREEPPAAATAAASMTFLDRKAATYRSSRPEPSKKLNRAVAREDEPPATATTVVTSMTPDAVASMAFRDRKVATSRSPRRAPCKKRDRAVAQEEHEPPATATSAAVAPEVVTSPMPDAIASMAFCDRKAAMSRSTQRAPPKKIHSAISREKRPTTATLAANVAPAVVKSSIPDAIASKAPQPLMPEALLAHVRIGGRPVETVEEKEALFRVGTRVYAQWPEDLRKFWTKASDTKEGKKKRGRFVLSVLVQSAVVGGVVVVFKTKLTPFRCVLEWVNVTGQSCCLICEWDYAVCYWATITKKGPRNEAGRIQYTVAYVDGDEATVDCSQMDSLDQVLRFMQHDKFFVNPPPKGWRKEAQRRK